MFICPSRFPFVMDLMPVNSFYRNNLTIKSSWIIDSVEARHHCHVTKKNKRWYLKHNILGGKIIFLQEGSDRREKRQGNITPY